jgi:glycine/D-amino acid oxidase-like deaminating enzyme
MPSTTRVKANGFDVAAAALQDFRAGLRGALLQPGDAGYDVARRVWNGAIDRKPALIARCTGAADVVRAVNFARTNNLLVSVRGGGHNVTGNAVCDGGLMIDLSPMKGIRVDAARRTVQAQAGLTWGELDHETQAFGLATTGGQISTTGIAGLTLGGGLGWLMRDSPDAVEVSEASCAVLARAAGRISTALAGAAILRRQACYRPVTDDGLPLIGRVPAVARAYVATGHGPWGILNAPATGLALAELMTDGGSSVDLRPFDPTRLPVARR